MSSLNLSPYSSVITSVVSGFTNSFQPFYIRAICVPTFAPESIKTFTPRAKRFFFFFSPQARDHLKSFFFFSSSFLSNTKHDPESTCFVPIPDVPYVSSLYTSFVTSKRVTTSNKLIRAIIAKRTRVSLVLNVLTHVDELLTRAREWIQNSSKSQSYRSSVTWLRRVI